MVGCAHGCFVRMGVKWLQGRSFSKSGDNYPVRPGCSSTTMFSFSFLPSLSNHCPSRGPQTDDNSKNKQHHLSPLSPGHVSMRLPIYHLPCFPAALWSSTELGNLKTCDSLLRSRRCFCVCLEEREMKTTLIFIPPFSVHHSSAVRVTQQRWGC